MAVLNQLPESVDLTFLAGDTFRIRVRVLDPDTAVAEDLTAYKFCAQIVNMERSVVSEFTIDPDPDDPDAAVILTLPPSETELLPGMHSDGKRFEGLWDLEVTFPNTDVRTVAAGSVICGIDVSHCVP